jgi:uncharacterized membrane protein
MSKTVISTFNSRDSAERAVSDLRSKGFDKEVSIVAKDDKGSVEHKKDYNAPTMGGDPLSDGATTGSVLGGIAGLVAGAGALAIPGIGPIVAAGPIAALLSGAATGGIAGGLIDWGIPAERSRYYEDRIKQGNVLVSVRTDDNRVNDAASVLRRYGSQDVEVH